MRFLQLLLLFTFGFLHAQEEAVHSVYFDFDKSTISEKQGEELISFIKKTDSTRIESIEIFGYTDDVGKEAYNFKLSTKRASVIQTKMIESGIKNKIIVTIEGKGRILIDDDIVENLPEKRSKNRRVDIVINLKPLPKIEIPGFYNSIQKNHIVGDHIYLDNILFDRGSSKLTFKAKTELDKVAKLLHKYKNLQFEIQGHVCCTPPYQKEAIDKETRKRALSTNRAESVFKYLAFKKIPKNRMTFKGYGNTVPLGKGAEYDRRVELVITKI
ncbi:MAG: OmpA family protein [Flavobacterium sp.]|jgi:outer membrane protein OmpA-like peptidoglycan-associated protein|uniref:OmpA family protein n=1 Tax=Flavobacterium macrobrachii TaxID=591204 RepID=A0ABS2D0U0_9FLAO|nr:MULTISPECIES: OmpA family protein [Flavobacterium]MBM6500790.1 OmpA family protein [Flavobacterium macrobrachii]MCZ8089320.1 OmpA family protein [Flavobacterium sp.]MCZ8330005.1 OmpA family protein [Flavobacterium sp.]PZO30035.1 MAG: OmpA family protein [Flavobacteriaceae bacterium]